MGESLFRAGLVTPHCMSSTLKKTARSAAGPDTLSSSACQGVKGDFYSVMRLFRLYIFQALSVRFILTNNVWGVVKVL